MGFTYPPIIGDSTLYNPRFYPSIGADGVLTYDFAQTLYLSKNDFRLSYLSGVIPGSATSGSALVLDETLSLSGLGSVSCSALTVGGVAVGTLPSFLTGMTPGTAANNKALVLGASGEVATITMLTAMNIYGSIKTGAQTSITSVGTLSSLAISTANSTTNASFMSDYALSLTNPISTNGNQVGMVFGVSGNLLSAYTGGASIVHQRSDVQSIGSLRFNIRISQGPLDSLVEAFRVNADASCSFNFPMTIDGNLVFSGASRTITGLSSMEATKINATTYKQAGTTYDLSLVNRLSLTTLGSAEASKALVLDSTSSARGVASLEINQTATLSASSTMDAFGLILRRNSATIGDTSGIALGVTNVSSISTTTGGASVIFTRTGSQGIGTLSFNLRTSSATAMTPLSEVLTFNADGSSTFPYAVSFSNNVSISGIANIGSVQIGGTGIITSGRHIQNIGNIACSGTMNAFSGYQVNGSTLADSSRNVFAASVLADYAQLDKTAGSVYSSTLLTNQYNLALSSSSNVSATFSGLAFHIDTAPLSGATPGACIISERDSTTAYDGSSISFCTKGTAGSANALTKRMTITKTGAINLGAGTSSDGDLLLIKSAASPLFRFGSALSTKNCISLQWNYAGAAFDANRLSFDIYGSSNLLSLNANRRVCINGDAPTSQFHIVSTGDNMYSTNWERVTEYWGSLGVKAGVIIYKEAGGSNANGVSWGTYTNDPINWFIGGTNCMQLNTSKRLNINRSSGPEATLHAGGMIWADELFHSKQNVDGKCVYRTNWSQSNYLGMGTDATVGAMRLGVCDTNFNWVSYAPVRGGAYTNASDRRIKQDIIDIPYGLAEVLRMQPRKFAMRNDQSQHVGFIAQEMLEIVPECISGVESPDDELNDQGEPINPKGIDLASLVSVLCKAVQELKKELEILEKDLIDVHTRLDELRSSTA
jgi:hypothetical protein